MRIVWFADMRRDAVRVLWSDPRWPQEPRWIA